MQEDDIVSRAPIGLTPYIQVAGLSNTGKTIIRLILEDALRKYGFNVEVYDLDGCTLPDGASIDELVASLREQNHRIFDNPIRIFECQLATNKHSSR